MNQNSKENKDRSDENIDETLDLAIKNAEIRKELSDTELDEIAGGKITAGSFGICNKET
jgi:bacteriocin-like protein